MIGSDIIQAAKIIKEGGLVAIPTETVYGLAANALDEKAVARVFETKNRPLSNPLIVHVGGISDIENYAHNIPDLAYTLLERFSPGPITVLLQKRNNIPGIVTANMDTVGIRIPNHPLTLELLKVAGVPLAAPSANPFGYISPTTAMHVSKSLADKDIYVLDGGACSAGIESTIVGFPDGVPTLYREGAISKAEIEEVAGRLSIYAGGHTVTPGSSPSHYAPNTKFILCDDPDEAILKYTGKKIGVIGYDRLSDLLNPAHQILLSANNNIEVAAHNLYAALHEMDSRGYDMIIAKKVPDSGIGRAINDRLSRATKKVYG